MDLRDPTTFAGIYEEHRQALQRIALAVLGDPAQADDVVQDVFVRLWRNPTRFDAARGSIATYLRLLARSRAVDLWREGRAADRAGDRLAAVVAVGGGPTAERPDRAVERRGDRLLVHAALAGLPVAQREALLLAYWGGLTADEIARRAGIPLGTAKSRIRLGLAKLHEELDDTAVAMAA